MGPHELPGSPTGDLPQLLHARMMGQHRGLGGPSTAELLDVTGQVSITQLLSSHRFMRLGHVARKPETTTVNNCCLQSPTWGAPGQTGRHHYMWMDEASAP